MQYTQFGRRPGFLTRTELVTEAEGSLLLSRHTSTMNACPIITGIIISALDHLFFSVLW